MVPGLSSDRFTCRSWEQRSLQTTCELDFSYNRGISKASTLVVHIRGQVYETDPSRARQENLGSVEGGFDFDGVPDKAAHSVEYKSQTRGIRVQRFRVS